MPAIASLTGLASAGVCRFTAVHHIAIAVETAFGALASALFANHTHRANGAASAAVFRIRCQIRTRLAAFGQFAAINIAHAIDAQLICSTFIEASTAVLFVVLQIDTAAITLDRREITAIGDFHLLALAA